jgi:hypothetical protein
MARKRTAKRRKSTAEKREAQAASAAEAVTETATPAHARLGKTDLAGAGRVTVRPVLATSVVAAIIVLIAVVSIWTG